MPPVNSSAQFRLLCAALWLLAMSVSRGVLAQPIPAPVLAWPGLTQDDIDRMHAAAARLYQGRSIGTVERWRGPDSKTAGVVKLIHSFDSHGMPCRTIDYTIRYESARNNPDHYILNWCRVTGDTWKIVELARPR